MADSTIFEPLPFVDIHIQTPDNEILEELPSLFKTELGKLSSFTVSHSNDDLDSCISASSLSSVKSYPSAAGCLWRKYGVEKENGDHAGRETLEAHEMAVYGTYVDERILPGFRYHVRIPPKTKNGKNRFQFGGQALHLLRVGQGYGKRLTFESAYANINTNFFWSDTHPNGYAFTISAVQLGEEFVLCHQNKRPFGRATVVAASRRQFEIGSSITEDKDIVKRVVVALQISVSYTSEPHGMMSLRADEVMDVMGVAMVLKTARNSRAVTRCIEEVEIPGHGECLLYNEDG